MAPSAGTRFPQVGGPSATMRPAAASWQQAVAARTTSTVMPSHSRAPPAAVRQAAPASKGTRGARKAASAWRTFRADFRISTATVHRSMTVPDTLLAIGLAGVTGVTGWSLPPSGTQTTPRHARPVPLSSRTQRQHASRFAGFPRRVATRNFVQQPVSQCVPKDRAPRLTTTAATATVVAIVPPVAACAAETRDQTVTDTLSKVGAAPLGILGPLASMVLNQRHPRPRRILPHTPPRTPPPLRRPSRPRSRAVRSCLHPSACAAARILL